MTTHGMSYSAEYFAWREAKYRCTRPTHQNYPHYGGRGIRMCEQWLNSFEAFYAHMGPRPSEAHSLNRIDNDGHYEPGNCAWATLEEQARNKSNNRKLRHEGVDKTVAQLAEETGLSPHRIFQRLDQQGDSLERALRPVKVRPLYEHDGRSLTLTEWSKVTGIGKTTLHRRIHDLGWSIAKALTTPT